MSNPAQAEDDGSLRQLVAKGAAWILGGVAVRQVLRLVSSVVVTRLLLPDEFGLATTALLLMSFVEMCADFGIRQAIVHHPKGSSPHFLDLAWTMTLWRSFVVSAAILLLAGPFAAACENERLVVLARITAVLPILNAACSPARLAWMRELRQDRINQLDLAVDVTRLPLNIVFALSIGDATGIVLAGVAAEAIRVVLSYVMAPGRPRLVHDATSAGELLRYGRFVFVSSVLGFMAVRLDSFFVIKFLGEKTAGIYAIAQNLSVPIEGIVSQLLAGLLFPYLARHQQDPDRIRARMRQVLKWLLLVGVPATALGVLIAPFVVDVLYDDRYLDVAGPLQWMLVSTFLSCLGTALNCPLMATGRPQWGTLATAVRLAVFAGAAWWLGDFGAVGYAAAITASTLGFTLAIAFVPWTPRPKTG